MFLKCGGKDNFKELTILIPKTFLPGGVPTKEFSIRIQLVPFDKQSCAFSSSNLFSEKPFFTWNFKFLQILILQTGRSILNTVICTAYFSDNFDSVFSKKNRETFLCLCGVVCKKKRRRRRRTDWILRILSLNNKNSLYLSLILTLQFFEGLSCQAGHN